ncbi:MAG: zinc-binding dehydrogenase [Planctomycetota bacterium]
MPDRPTHCRAAILHELKKPLVLADIELPETLAPGQVLVRVDYSGVCGSQIGEIAGVKGHDPWLPHLLGHEGGGVVSEVGPGVKRMKPGDHVVLHWRKAAGIDAAPPKYRWDGRTVNAGFVTTFNRWAVVSENRLTPIPKDFPLDIASFFGCPVTTGLGVIRNNARLTLGESILIIGAGGVGLNIVQGAAMSGAHPVVAVDLFDSRLDLAERMGATHRINTSDEDLAEAAKAACPAGYDVVVENTGNPAIIRHAYDLTQPQGRTILVGVPKAGADASLYTLPLHFGKVITGSFGGEAVPDRDIPQYLKLHAAGKLELEALATDRYPLERINDALDDLRSGKVAGRCVIHLDPEAAPETAGAP